MVNLSLPDDERGQLLLVGAAAIALVIVGSVILLNGLKFTDTVGTEGNFDATDDAHRTAETVRQDLTEMATRVRSQTGLVNFERAMRRNTSIYSNRLTNMTFADSATYVNVSLNESASKSGPLVTQNVSDGADFRNSDWGSGSPPHRTYDVAREATTLGPFNFTVTEFPCKQGDDVTNTNLTVTVGNTSTGNTWEMRLARNTGGPACSSAAAANQGTRYIEIYDDSGTQLESYASEEESWFPEVGAGQVEINLIAGEVNGQSVDLHFAEGVDPEYTVTFENKIGAGSEHGRGAYWIGSDGSFPEESHDSSSDPPSVQEHVQRPAFTVVYERQAVTYNTTVLEGEG